MEEIFLKYNTDKNSKFHNYTRQYEKLFENYRDCKLKVLEIGVYKGESLKAWKEFFTHEETVVVGVDILEECKLCFENVEIGDSTDKEFMKMVHEKYGPFDIIIDDGGHRNGQVIKTFEIMFPLLNDKGLYIVEDTVCFNDYSFMDHDYPDHLNYFIQFLPFLNQHRKEDYCVDPFKNTKKTKNVFEYSIDKMEFGCSYIAISKLVRGHWII